MTIANLAPESQSPALLATSWGDDAPAVAAAASANLAMASSPGPSILHLVLLVSEAVMEVVCVCLPGYIIARMGQFDAENQKFLANLNVNLFTPCLGASFFLIITRNYSTLRILLLGFAG